MKKRGQKAIPGSAAGALIGIITIVIVFYIILIPPAEREKLLGDEPYAPVDDYIPGEAGETEEEGILQEYIGRLESVDYKTYEHSIPSIFLKEITESVLLTEENPFIIKKGITSQYKTIEFALQDPENTDNVLITFNAPTHNGVLKIIANEQTIFEGEIQTQSPPPIKINKKYLQEQNKIELQVHGFGIPAKTYEIENLKIIGDITNIKKQEASHLLTIQAAEYDNMERANLDYTPICNQASAGIIEVYINKNLMFSGVPNCDSMARIDLYPEDLNKGRNEIEYRLINGMISIEQIRLKTYMRTQEKWSNYFYITEKDYERVDNGYNAILDIEFADDGYLKEAEININGRLQKIDQTEPDFIRDISSAIKKGNNYIAIKPESNLNILNLEIKIE
jgi:hypothetical protein